MTNQKESEPSDTRTLAKTYSSLSPIEDRNEAVWRHMDGPDDLELSVIDNANCTAIDEDILLEELKVEYFPVSFHNLIIKVAKIVCYLMI